MLGVCEVLFVGVGCGGCGLCCVKWVCSVR